MTPDPTRRRTLALLGTGLTVGIAGCSGGGGDGTDDTPAGPGDGDPSGASGGTASPGDADGTPTETPGGGASSETTPFTLSLSGGFEDFESLVVAVGTVTLQSASGDGRVTRDASGATVDLATADRRNPKTVLDAPAVPTGTYDAVTIETTVRTATLSDGSAADVSGGTLEQSLVIDDPAEFTTRWDSSMQLYLGYEGSGPYALTVSGWQGTGV